MKKIFFGATVLTLVAAGSSAIASIKGYLYSNQDSVDISVRLNSDDEPVITTHVKGKIDNCPLVVSDWNPVQRSNPANFSEEEMKTLGDVQFLSIWQDRDCLAQQTSQVDGLKTQWNFIDLIVGGGSDREKARQVFREAPVMLSFCFGFADQHLCSQPFSYQDLAKQKKSTDLKVFPRN